MRTVDVLESFHRHREVVRRNPDRHPLVFHPVRASVPESMRGDALGVQSGVFDDLLEGYLNVRIVTCTILLMDVIRPQ